MDRSFLSQPEVINASRSFVCVRLTTYENKQEAELLKSLFTGGSGEVENTTFAILSPDGQKQLVRASRSARETLSNSARMAETMNRLAAQYQGKKVAGGPELPKVGSVRLALDVAACDNQPLVVLFARDETKLRQLEERTRALAWKDEFIGRVVYTVTADADQLKAIDGMAAQGGLLVVQSDRFGQKGTVLAQAGPDAEPADLAKALETGLGRFERAVKKFEAHIREGHRSGIFWETEVPVTDPMERRAREQGRKMVAP
jgi:hypothetical protein